MQVAKTVLYKAIKAAITDKAKLKEIRENLEKLQKQDVKCGVDFGHPDVGWCFLWSETPQGYQYWSNIAAAQLRYIEQQDEKCLAQTV